MQALKAYVKDGHIVTDEPMDLAEGTQLTIIVVPGDDDISAEERAELLQAIDEGLADVDAGDEVDFDEAVASLGTNT